uniref:Hypotheticial protein n=1 Tax=Schistosoma japonicum TaxID=6182 RepID=C1LE21_SCHJA|nr:hypotheticial protein [Schistosoma japonicum]
MELNKRATVDNNFFRKLSWEELEKDLSDLNTTTSTEIHDDFQQTKDDLVKIDIEYLFVRVQYTLKNQIGRTSNKFSSSPEAIDRYVKQVFGLTQEVYDVLCAQACQAELPMYSYTNMFTFMCKLDNQDRSKTLVSQIQTTALLLTFSKCSR